MIIELFYACSELARLARRLRQEIGLDPPLGRDGAEPHWGPRRAPHFTAGSTFRICLPLAESVRVLKNAMRPQPNAWLRSAIRSSGSSIPTEMRISVGVIPSRNRSFSGMSEWVIAAGCEASVSVPPRLTASLITLSRSRTAKASASPPLTSKLNVEPGLLHWRSKTGRSGWPSGKNPRYQTDATFG